MSLTTLHTISPIEALKLELQHKKSSLEAELKTISSSLDRLVFAVRDRDTLEAHRTRLVEAIDVLDEALQRLDRYED